LFGSSHFIVVTGGTRVSRIHFTGKEKVYYLLSYKGPLFRRSKARERRRGTEGEGGER
jgi:hypothetical protein